MSFAYLSSTPGLKYNYSLYSIPVGWVVNMAPLWWAVGATSQSSTGEAYDNSLPKEYWSRLDAKGLDPVLRRRIAKAVAANNNGEANLALFAGCLAGANAAHVESSFLHLASLNFLVSRVAYNLAYIFIDDSAKSYIRTLCYWSGIGSCFALAIQGARKMAALPW